MLSSRERNKNLNNLNAIPYTISFFTMAGKFAYISISRVLSAVKKFIDDALIVLLSRYRDYNGRIRGFNSDINNLSRRWKAEIILTSEIPGDACPRNRGASGFGTSRRGCGATATERERLAAACN